MPPLLLCLHVVTILVARAGLQQVVQRVFSRSEFVQDSSGFSSGFSSSQQAGNDVMLGGGGGASAADGESGGGGYYQWCSSLSQTMRRNRTAECQDCLKRYRKYVIRHAAFKTKHGIIGIIIV